MLRTSETTQATASAIELFYLHNGRRQLLSVEMVKSFLNLRIHQWKNYSAAADFIFDVFNCSLDEWKKKNPMYSTDELSVAIHFILNSLAFDSFSSEVLKKIFTFECFNHRLIEALSFCESAICAIPSLIKIHTDISAYDSEHYHESFKRLMLKLHSVSKDQDYERMSPPIAHHKREILRSILEACGALLSTKNATADWYLYAASNTSIMNEFARYGMTEYFKQGMAKGVSIGPQKTGTNLITRKQLSETPLYVALKHKQQAIIDLIKAEIKKEAEKKILEMFLQEKYLISPDQILQSLYSKFLRVTDLKYENFTEEDKQTSYSILDAMQEAIGDFNSLWIQAETAGKQALEAALTEHGETLHFGKRIKCVVNAMRDKFAHQEFPEIETILMNLAHQIVSERKRNGKRKELSKHEIEAAKIARDKNEIHWPSFQIYLLDAIDLHATQFITNNEAVVKPRLREFITNLDPNIRDNQRKMFLIMNSVLHHESEQYIADRIFNADVPSGRVVLDKKMHPVGHSAASQALQISSGEALAAYTWCGVSCEKFDSPEVRAAIKWFETDHNLIAHSQSAVDQLTLSSAPAAQPMSSPEPKNEVEIHPLDKLLAQPSLPCPEKPAAIIDFHKTVSHENKKSIDDTEMGETVTTPAAAPSSSTSSILTSSSAMFQPQQRSVIPAPPAINVSHDDEIGRLLRAVVVPTSTPSKKVTTVEHERMHTQQMAPMLV